MEENYCRSCLGNFIIHSNHKAGPDCDVISVEQGTLEGRREVFVIELNAQPSFIIFSYLLTPRRFIWLWPSLDTELEKIFIILDDSSFAFSRKLCLDRGRSFWFLFSGASSSLWGNLKPFCSAYVCFRSPRSRCLTIHCIVC